MNRIRIESPPSHRDRIYAELIAAIQSGEIGWSDKLVDVTLAPKMGVSRMPVRDALMRLCAEGFLVSTTRGFMLPRLTPEQVLDVFDLRRLLEPRAVALAAQVMTPEAHATLEAAVRDGAAALETGRTPELFRASERFRATWLALVPNRALVETIRRYFIQVQNVRLATMGDPATLRVILGGQQDLMAAFRDRDAVRAADRMLRFVVAAEQAYVQALASQTAGVAPGLPTALAAPAGGEGAAP